MDKRLRILLELVSEGFNSGAQAARNAFKALVAGITEGALTAGRGIVDLARSVFFLREAFQTVAQVARWLFDTFIQGAGDAAKTEAKLTALTGSAEDAAKVIEYLRNVAGETGQSFDELASAAALVSSAAKDASGRFDFEKFQRLNGVLQRMAALRPDVPIDRLARGLLAWLRGEYQSLEMFLDQPLKRLAGIQDEADKLDQTREQIGRSTGHIEDAMAQAASDAETNLASLDEALNKLGATSEMVGNVAEKAGLERFLQLLDQITDSIGEGAFNALNEELSKFADWLQANPEKVGEFTLVLSDLGEKGIKAVFDALSNIDWDTTTDGILQLAHGLEVIANSLDTISKLAGVLPEILGTGRALEQTPEQNAAAMEQAGMSPGLSKFLAKANQASAEGLQPPQIDFQGIGQSLTQNQIAAWLERQIGQIGGQQQPQRVVVEVDLKNDMLDARVRQTADQAVTDGLNNVAEEMNR